MKLTEKINNIIASSLIQLFSGILRTFYKSYPTHFGKFGQMRKINPNSTKSYSKLPHLPTFYPKLH